MLRNERKIVTSIVIALVLTFGMMIFGMIAANA